MTTDASRCGAAMRRPPRPLPSSPRRLFAEDAAPVYAAEMLGGSLAHYARGTRPTLHRRVIVMSSYMGGLIGPATELRVLSARRVQWNSNDHIIRTVCMTHAQPLPLTATRSKSGSPATCRSSRNYSDQSHIRRTRCRRSVGSVDWREGPEPVGSVGGS